MSHRRQLLALLLVFLAIALISYFWRAESLAIVYIGRNLAPYVDRQHEELIEDRVHQYNREHPGGVRLRFERRDANSEALAAIYQEIEERSDVIAVIDNCWGKEIKDVSSAIRAVKAPIIFLNADWNGINFGTNNGARIFLGDAEVVVRYQMLPLLEELVKRAGLKNLIFMGEDEYLLTGLFRNLLSARKGFEKLRAIELRGDDPSDDELLRVQKELTSMIGENVEKSDPRVIILNSHATWGTKLLKFIDETFHNVTVVGYESISSGTAGPLMNEAHRNQAIILGQSPRSVPDVLVDIYQNQKRQHPTLYGKGNDMLHVRRSFVAMDLVTHQLIEAQRPRPVGEAAAATVIQQVNNQLQKLNGGLRSVTSSLGILQFNGTGVEQGSSHMMVHRNGTVSSHLTQVNFKENIIPNIQFGFRNIKITDVNVETKTFHADFDFWVRCEDELVLKLFSPLEASAAASQKASAAPQQAKESSAPPQQDRVAAVIMKLFEFPGHVTEGFQMGVVSIQKFTTPSPTVSQMFFHVSSRFAGNFVGSGYPFDEQEIAIQIRVSLSDSAVRITPDQYEMSGSEPEADIDGWRTMSNKMTVNSRMADQILLPRDYLTDEIQQQQYSEARLSFTVRRSFWSPALLVFCPLALMTLASLAVLFIRNQHGHSGDIETGSQHTELTLICMLAVVTYLIAYASLAPRLAEPTLADGLVGFTLLISVFNFVFCAVQFRRNTQIVSLEDYRTGASALAVLVFVGWIVATAIF